MSALIDLKKLKEQGIQYKEERPKIEEVEEKAIETQKECVVGFPQKLANDELERAYLGVLLNEIKAIAVYYFPYEDAYFVNDDLLNIYKTIIFTDGDKYAWVYELAQ